MSWYNEAIFYHIYPLGLTGAPKTNDYSASVSRLNTLLPWIDHIKEIGCTALYTGGWNMGMYPPFRYRAEAEILHRREGGWPAGGTG